MPRRKHLSGSFPGNDFGDQASIYIYVYIYMYIYIYVYAYVNINTYEYLKNIEYEIWTIYHVQPKKRA